MVPLTKDMFPREYFILEKFFEDIWNVTVTTLDSVYEDLKKLRNQDLLRDKIVVDLLNNMASVQCKKIKLISTIAERFIRDFNVDWDNDNIDFKDKVLYTILALKDLCPGCNIPFEMSGRSLEDLYSYYPRDSIEYAIMTDDLPRFKKFAEKKGFDFEMKITEQEFLIDFVCKFGSMHVFDYVFNHCKGLSQLSVEQAYFACNPDMIAFFESRMEPTVICCRNALYMHRYDIVERHYEKFKLEPAFLDCVRYFSLKGLTQILLRHKDVNYCDRFGENAIFSVIRRDFDFMTKFLLEQGSDITIRNKHNNLAFAYSGFSPKSLIMFLEKGQNPNEIDSNRKTYVMADALSSGSAEAVSELIDRGANFKLIGMPVFYNAARSGSYDLVKFLLSKGFNVNERPAGSISPLSLIPDDPELAKLFVESGVDPCEKNSYGTDSFVVHLRRNHGKVCEYLLPFVKNPNLIDSSGISLIMMAASSRLTNIVEKLIQKGADINYKTKGSELTALHLGVSSQIQNLDALEVLLKNGLDINSADSEGSTALHYCAKYNRIKAAQFLIEHGADIERENKLGETTLAYGCKKPGVPNTEFLRYIIDRHGANVDHLDKQGNTPLALAAKNENNDAARILLDSKPKLNVLSGSDETETMIAAKIGNIAFIELLKDNKVLNPNFQNSEGRTCLHFAAVNKKVEVAIKLIQMGADVRIKDKFGRIVYHYACKYNLKQLVLFLIKYKVDMNVADNKQNMPIIYALKKGYNEIIVEMISTNRCKLDEKACTLALRNFDYNVMSTIEKYHNNGILGKTLHHILFD